MMGCGVKKQVYNLGSTVHGTVSSAGVIRLLLVDWPEVKRRDDRGEKHCAWNSKPCNSDHIAVSWRDEG